MPKSANQKLKLLYLMQYLLQKSDEEHPISIQQMVDELSRHDIKAERKTLYDDMEALGKPHALFGHRLVSVIAKTLDIAHKTAHGKHQHIYAFVSNFFRPL